jgi:hypothetical protein
MKVTKNQLALLVFQPAYEPGISNKSLEYSWSVLFPSPPPLLNMKKKSLSRRHNRFECAVGGVRHPQHTQTCSNSSTIAADSSNGVTNTKCCRYSCMRS